MTSLTGSKIVAKNCPGWNVLVLVFSLHKEDSEIRTSRTCEHTEAYSVRNQFVVEDKITAELSAIHGLPQS